MRDKVDLRVKRTKKLLSEALLRLLQKESFDKITVNDICEESMVHRATFYNHFKDKTELLYFVFDEIQDKLFLESVVKNAKSEREMYYTLAESFLDFLYKNQKGIKLVLGHCTSNLHNIIFSTVRNAVLFLATKKKWGDKINVPVDIIVDFYTGAISTVCVSWILNDHNYKKEEMMNYCKVMLDGVVFCEK